jgi:hypothetical protein
MDISIRANEDHDGIPKLNDGKAGHGIKRG